ncbi:hypothetical protein LIER_24834 [Lithospermum erythrorhizon]|uniref:Uncharacterized protein n=1 Tax=Lithospermum erythrorhizon TaxID=34254 RepID=A0AAV3R416_LITER
MTTSSNIEEQVASFTKTLEGLAKYIESQDAKISMIIEKVATDIEGKSRTEASLKASVIHEVLESSKRNKSNDSSIQISADGVILMN